MKKWIFLLIAVSLSGCASGNIIPQHRLPVPDGFEFPEKVAELDVYETGRFDFDGDGLPEQIVIDSGGGTGGSIWHIRRWNGIILSDEIFGSVTLLKKKNGFYQLRVESQCGWSERHFSLYSFNGEKYVRVRFESHNYEKNTVEITTTTTMKTYHPVPTGEDNFWDEFQLGN